MRNFLLMLIAFGLALAGPAKGGDMTPLAKAATTKARFLEREPIEVELTVSNHGPAAIEIGLDYPAFQLPGSIQVSWDLAQTKLEPTSLPKKEWGGRMPMIPLAAGQHWSIPIYLQRYVQEPKPSHYRIPYTIHLPYRVASSGPSHVQRTASSTGDLEFTIDPGHPETLAHTLQVHAMRLARPDFWQRRAAIEALSVVDDPVVIPHLVNMLANAGQADHALKALAGFSQNAEAHDAVLQCLHSDRVPVLTQAIEVLAAWQYELNVETVKDFLERDNAEVRKAALGYIKSINKEKYSALLQPESRR